MPRVPQETFLRHAMPRKPTVRAFRTMGVLGLVWFLPKLSMWASFPHSLELVGVRGGNRYCFGYF